jgi:hypothetical protein
MEQTKLRSPEKRKTQSNLVTGKKQIPFTTCSARTPIPDPKRHEAVSDEVRD